MSVLTHSPESPTGEPTEFIETMQVGASSRSGLARLWSSARVCRLRVVRSCLVVGCATAFLVALCSCASVTEVSEGAARILPSETPLHPEAGHFGLILLPVSMESGEPMWFILDTGAPYTLLDASLEPKLGKPLGRSRSRSVYGIMPGHLYQAPALLLNGTPLQTGHRIGTADLRRLGDDLSRVTHAERRIMGVLGMDCLGHYCIQLDFADRRLRFLDPGHLYKEALGKPFPLSFSRNAVYVNQNLLGKAERTQVDTGANFDGELTAKAFRQWSRSKGPLVEEDGVGCFAGERYTNLSITADGNYGNVIGLRFLARHLVTLDFPSRIMYLNRMPTQPPPADASTSRP